jgi:carbonic anhydrase
MCQSCGCLTAAHGTPASRRHFLRFAGTAVAGVALTSSGFAAKAPRPKAPPPKPENILAPDAALSRLVKGNGRYVAGVTKRHDFKSEREALTTGQNPYAAILSCADSRIAPEYAFDSARGDLFVCRVAGNFANDDVVASFEYGIAVLNCPLLMVLGHAACGAIDATIKSMKDGTTLPGHLPSLVAALTPAVKASASQPGNALDNAIKQNVLLNVEKLKSATPIIDKAIADKKVRIVGAVYNLSNGRVEILS